MLEPSSSHIMEKFQIFPTFLYFLSTLSCFLLSPVSSNIAPMRNFNAKHNNSLADSSNDNSAAVLDNLKGCVREEFDIQEVVFLNNTDIFLKNKNLTVHSSHYHAKSGKVHVCLNVLKDNRAALVADCSSKFVYDNHEFRILPNKSALLFGEIVEPGEYELKDGQLLICDTDEEDDFGGNKTTSSGLTLNEVSIYVGKIGSAISIVALVMHIFTFCFVPTLRNLPGYNLASLSVAFLLAYSFHLIGQIPEVLGLFCVISGILQQNFFLAAFFCMNVLAFDVWKTLKLATEKLIVGSNNVHKRQFVWYSLYAWGCPLNISIISVIVDNVDGVPEKIKPHFGREDVCWMTNNFAKTIFFAVPAFTLFIINGIFFIRSSIMISQNTMKCTNEQQKQNVKLNYVLYLRLGLMMGLTWLIGVIALISRNKIVWFIHDFLNSLQGLFLFLLFTCTRKVVKHLRGKASFKSGSSEKQISVMTSKFDSH